MVCVEIYFFLGKCSSRILSFHIVGIESIATFFRKRPRYKSHKEVGMAAQLPEPCLAQYVSFAVPRELLRVSRKFLMRSFQFPTVHLNTVLLNHLF